MIFSFSFGIICRQIKIKRRVAIVVNQPKRSGRFTDFIISSISLSFYFFCLKSPELLFIATEQKATMAMALWLLFSPFLLLLSVSANTQTKVTDNPADELVAALNANRTAHKSSSLYDNPGLACIALQYIKAYQGDCNAVGGPDAKKPADSEFAQTFAPNCGIDASTLSPITGRLLGCQSKYVQPSEAFSMLMKNDKSLEILYSKNHTEVGAAVTGTDGGVPYFWCVLFSNGKKNSSFVLEGGVAKITKPGCFSGANDECSGADDFSRSGHVWLYVVTAFIAAAYALGL
ncbi:hypothetical protein PTKIN_Ptkin03bG0214600 [Pterospermum kingtungense]